MPLYILEYFQSICSAIFFSYELDTEEYSLNIITPLFCFAFMIKITILAERIASRQLDFIDKV